MIHRKRLILANGEALRIQGGGFGGLESTDVGARRTRAKPRFEFLQLRPRSTGIHFQTSVVQIAGPARNSGGARRAFSEVAESGPLHPPGKDISSRHEPIRIHKKHHGDFPAFSPAISLKTGPETYSNRSLTRSLML